MLFIDEGQQNIRQNCSVTHVLKLPCFFSSGPDVPHFQGGYRASARHETNGGDIWHPDGAKIKQEHENIKAGQPASRSVRLDIS